MKPLLVILAFVGFMAVISGQVKSGTTSSARPATSSSSEAPRKSLQPIPTAGLTVEAKREIVAELRRLESTLPHPGQQMGVSSCGQPVYCAGDPRAEVRAEIARIEREIATGR